MSTSSFLLLATLLAAGTMSCRQSARERDTSADQQNVSQVGEREIRALSAGDVDGNLATLTQDVVMMPPNELVINGTAGVRTWLRGLHDQFTFNVRYTESHVVVAGD